MNPEQMMIMMKITMVTNIICAFLFWNKEKYGMSKVAITLSLVSVLVIIGLKQYI